MKTNLLQVCRRKIGKLLKKRILSDLYHKLVHCIPLKFLFSFFLCLAEALLAREDLPAVEDDEDIGVGPGSGDVAGVDRNLIRNICDEVKQLCISL